MKFYVSLGLIMSTLLSASTGSAQTPAPFSLPPNFRFCVSTAAYQVEGNDIHSDWWQWEQQPGKIKNNDKSGVATDAFNHLDEDIQNMTSLGVANVKSPLIDLYRFSVEWAKIEPSEGVYDEAELAQYQQQIARLHAAGIESMITLYHFTLPQWVAEKGGWEWNGIAKAFEGFTQKVVNALGKDANGKPTVKLWITLNEPMSIIAGGYISDVFPPARNDIRSIGLPMINMVKAHALSYYKIHELLDSDDFKPSVGLAHHLRVFDPWRKHNPLDRFASRKFDEIFNWAIPEAIKTGRLKFSMPLVVHVNVDIPEIKKNDPAQTQDFFGLNYYSRDEIAFHLFAKNKLDRKTARGAEVQDLGWEIYPEGMKRILDQVQLRFPHKPIWITENGLADKTDQKRAKFIKDHLRVLSEEIARGAPIYGYCHWTLNDNFEWAEGWTAHFGLYSLDPVTLKRVPRSSALEFGKMIQSVKSGQAIE